MLSRTKKQQGRRPRAGSAAEVPRHDRVHAATTAGATAAAASARAAAPLLRLLHFLCLLFLLDARSRRAAEEDEQEADYPYPYPLRTSVEVGESGSAPEFSDQKVNASGDGSRDGAKAAAMRGPGVGYAGDEMVLNR